MRRPKVCFQVDEKAFRAARDRPEAQETLDRLGQLIVGSFVKTLSSEDIALLVPWLKTREGKEAFRQSWPKIVDAYFHALCNPNRKT